MGCTKESICVRLEKKKWGDDKGSTCPGYCPPLECKENELLCPDDFHGRNRFDICDGCPLEKFCITPAIDQNGIVELSLYYIKIGKMFSELNIKIFLISSILLFRFKVSLIFSLT